MGHLGRGQWCCGQGDKGQWPEVYGPEGKDRIGAGAKRQGPETRAMSYDS